MNTNSADFPEVKWQVKPSAVWLSTGLLGVPLLSCLAGMISMMHVIGLPCFLGLLSLLLCILLYTNWITHHEAEFILNADGVYYTGWRKHLLFRDLESVYSVTNKGSMSLVFRLSPPESSPWKFNLFPSWKTKGVIFPLAHFQEKSSTISQTVSRYFTRE